MTKWTDIFFYKIQSLLGERGVKADHAVRWRDLTSSTSPNVLLSGVSAYDPRVPGLANTVTTLDGEMTAVQDAVNLAAIEASTANTKAQLVRDDHDALVSGFIGTLTDAFTSLQGEIATQSTTLQASIDGVGQNVIDGDAATLTSVNATLSTNYYTKAAVDGAISASIDTFEAEFRDSASGQIKATALTGYYTAAQTDSAVAAQSTTLQASIDAVDQSVQGWQVVTDSASGVSIGAAVTVSVGASALGQAGTLKITEGATARVVSGTTNGAVFTIPTNRAIIFAGQRIKIGVLARAPSTNAASKFGIAYSTNDNGISGYMASSAVLTTNWAWHTFYYDVPQAIAGGTDYLGVFGDDAKTGKTTEIARVYIEIAAVAGELPEINTLSGQITDILGLNISPSSALATSFTQLQASVSSAQNAADTAQTTADGAVSSLSTLSATVTTQGSAIATLEGNTSAGYLIKAQAGGAVSLLDLVAADGGAGPTSIAKLSAGQILLDGSVTAQQISVIGTANIADAAITTAKIGNNMVTFPQFANGVSMSDYAIPSAEAQIASITINQTGAPAWIFGEAIIVHTDGTNTQGDRHGRFNYTLKRNGSAISSVTGALTGGLNSPSFIMDTQSTSTGTTTYSLHIRPTGGTNTFIRVLQASIFIVELKR